MSTGLGSLTLRQVSSKPPTVAETLDGIGPFAGVSEYWLTSIQSSWLREGEISVLPALSSLTLDLTAENGASGGGAIRRWHIMF
jgi:hypothetical protein